jgi:CHAT domain-containing protein
VRRVPLSIAASLALAIVFSNSGCRHSLSPDATFLQIRDEMRRGQLDAALREVDAALGKYQARNPDWGARFRVQKAHILMLRGSYAESLQLLSQPMPPKLIPSDADIQAKMVRALDLNYLEQFKSAEDDIFEAEKLASGSNSSLRIDVAQAYGTIELSQKKYSEAGAAFRSVLVLARQQNQPSREVLALGSLGNVAMGNEHYDEAIEWFRLALQKAQAVGSLSSQSLALGNMGWNYFAVGDLENAEASFREAEEKAAQAGLVGNETYWLNSLAEVYFQQRRYSEADSTGQKALTLAEQHDNKNTLTTCLNTLSQIALATGRLGEAEKFNRKATDLENAGLDQFGINYSRLIAGRVAAGKHDYQAAQGALLKVLADPKAETPLKWEAHARLAEIYAVQHQPARAEHEFDIAIRTLRNARDSIQSNDFRVSFLSSAIAFYDEYVNFLIDQKRPLDALRIADLSRAQAFEQSFSTASGATTAKRALDPREIARRVQATLLFYWLGLQKSWLWVIAPAKTSLVPLPASGGLEGLVKSYRDTFTDPRDPLEAGNADGKKLYSVLIGPTEKLIPKNSRVIILPDAGLNSLNFETLIVSSPQPEEKAHYWIEDATVLTASSLSLLARSTVTAPPKTGNLLLMGEALPASPDFPPLPDAGKEVGVLEKYFAESQRLELTGKNATPAAFLGSQPEKFSYLHFATHGTASHLRPLESAVILSPDGDSYKLYARDVVKHPLNAYLVTISACNGTGTKTYAGEGLVGLSWAFLRAGAHNVIAGLWEVSNASTPQLMDQLYMGIHSGDDPATALRNAKLTLVHSTGNYRKPFYWAPFQLYLGS